MFFQSASRADRLHVELRFGHPPRHFASDLMKHRPNQAGELIVSSGRKRDEELFRPVPFPFPIQPRRSGLREKKRRKEEFLSMSVNCGAFELAAKARISSNGLEFSQKISFTVPVLGFQEPGALIPLPRPKIGRAHV